MGSVTFYYSNIESPEISQFSDQFSLYNNMAEDPLFYDAANGDLRLRPGSPCIDAALGSNATDTDIWGRPRVDDPSTTDSGDVDWIVASYADMGAFEYQPTFWTAFATQPGWNLISFPSDPDAGTPTDYFGAGAVAYAWDTATQDYVEVTAFEAGRGYFVFSFQPARTTYFPSYEAPTPISRNLSFRWNLVGPGTSGSGPTSSNTVIIYSYNAASSGYEVLSTGPTNNLSRGVGYWIFCSTATSSTF